MSRRGYLETQSGSKRLRFVMPGYDADDPDVPPNKVIFDSNDLGTLSILDTGSYSWGNATGSGGSTLIKSWNYDFVPLCTFQWEPPGGELEGSLLTTNVGSRKQMIVVSKTGITVDVYWGYITNMTVHWQAYRLAVT